VLTLRDGLGITVVLVTHELGSLFSIADRMIFLDGEAHRPVALGAPAELARSAESPKVRDFLAARRDAGIPRGGAMKQTSPTLVGVFPAGRPGVRCSHLLRQRKLLCSASPWSATSGIRGGPPDRRAGHISRVRVGEVKSIGIRLELDTSTQPLR
jgi:energy-coupling factor transporter ATP-binding protein EcfA2